MAGSSSSTGLKAALAGALQHRRLDADWQSEIDDRLVLEHFAAHERFSTPYIIYAEVLSPGGEIDFVHHLGKGACIDLRSDDLSLRKFHGFLFSAERFGANADGSVRYRLELRPWMHFLAQSSSWRIFQKKSVIDVIEKVLESHGSAFKADFTQLKKTYPKREYICQFGDSDYNFISRLMEEEGIYYYFAHKQDGHTLVACDDSKSHGESKGSFLYRPSHSGSRSGIWRFDPNSRRVVGSVDVTDYNYKKAASGSIHERIPLDTSNNAIKPTVLTEYPSYIADYDRLADFSLKSAMSHRAQREQFEVECGHPELGSGVLFDLVGHKLLDGPYLTVSADYDFVRGAPRSRGHQEVNELHLRLEVAPADGRAPWVPPRITPKRIARGPQTAVVVGPDSDKEIHTEEFGRVRVKFFWDRSDEDKGEDSCWMRVSHGWAGHNMGEFFLPRVGHEVIVDFLDGDPERPIVTGRVYNSVNEHAGKDKLPDKKMVSGWITQTVNGKSTQDYKDAVNPPTDEPGFNIFAFDDQSGQEEIYMRAQRDHEREIFRDMKANTHRDKTEKIGHNLSVEVMTGDEDRTITKGNRTTVIHKDEKLTVETGSRTTKINQKETLTVEEKDMSTEVSKGNQSTNIKMGDQSTELGMGNKSLSIKMGDQTTKLDLGSQSTEAMQQIELKVGQSSIVIDQMGVTIKGMMIKIEAQIQLEEKALMTQVNGDAMLTLKGGITMIN